MRDIEDIKEIHAEAAAFRAWTEKQENAEAARSSNAKPKKSSTGRRKAEKHLTTA